MKRTRVKSSNVYSVGHSTEPDNEDLGLKDVLEVEFSSGDVWQYKPISKQRHNALMSAASIGKYLNQNVKDADGVTAKKVN